MIREILKRGKKKAVLELLSEGVWTRQALENRLKTYIDGIIEELIREGKIEKVNVFVHDKKPPFYRKSVGYRIKNW